jgi:hypothetical protein
MLFPVILIGSILLISVIYGIQTSDRNEDLRI